jgi:hypothetical protein
MQPCAAWGCGAGAIPLLEGDLWMGFVFLASLVLLYLFSSKPGWFGCLLVLLVVGILVAGCG